MQYQLLCLYFEKFTIPQDDGSTFVLGQLTAVDLNNYREDQTFKGYPVMRFNVPDPSVVVDFDFPCLCDVRFRERGGKKGKNTLELKSLEFVKDIVIPDDEETLLVSFEKSQYTKEGRVTKRVRCEFIDLDSHYDEADRKGFKPIDLRVYDSDIKIFNGNLPTSVPGFYNSEFILSSDYDGKAVKKLKKLGQCIKSFDFLSV